MKTIKQLTWIAFAAISLIACKGKTSTKKGSNLKGEDAKTYLAGKEKKYWQLESGHDYNQFLTFYTDNQVSTPAGISTPSGSKFKYLLEADKLTIKDYKDYVYSIYEIGDGKLVMGLEGKDTLTYLFFEPGTEAFKKQNSEPYEVNPKWLKGKQYGTVWKFSQGDKAYAYMNNGVILEAGVGRKIADWKIEGSTLHFGSSKLQIKRLSPVFFDYDAFGIAVKMDYLGEANADGSFSGK